MNGGAVRKVNMRINEDVRKALEEEGWQVVHAEEWVESTFDPDANSYVTLQNGGLSIENVKTGERRRFVFSEVFDGGIAANRLNDFYEAPPSWFNVSLNKNVLRSTYEFYIRHRDFIKTWARWIPDRKVWVFFNDDAVEKMQELIDELHEKYSQSPVVYNAYHRPSGIDALAMKLPAWINKAPQV